MLWRNYLVNIGIAAALLAAVFAIAFWRNSQLPSSGLQRSVRSNGGVRAERVQAIEIDSKSPKLPTPPFTADWRGTLVIPQTRNYAFKTYTNGKAQLTIDGKTILQDAGKSPTQGAVARLALPAGSHDIAVRYESSSQPAFRLFWSIGAGGLETIPERLLFSGSAKEVDPKSATLYSQRNRTALALFFLTTFLAILLFARRQVLRRIRTLRADDARLGPLAICFGLGIAALLIRLWAGFAGDELIGEGYTLSAARNFVSGLFKMDLRPLSWLDYTQMPATSKWVYSWAALSQTPLSSARVFSALISATNVGLLFLFARDFFDRRVALFAGIFAALLPPLIAQGSLVSGDSISALFYLLAIWLFLRALRRDGNNGLYLVTALLLGLLWGTDLKNLTVIVPMTAAYFMNYGGRILRERVLPLPISLAFLPILAAFFVVISWPGIWTNPELVLSSFSGRAPQPILEFLFGTRQSPPYYYSPLYFGATLPVVFLGFFATGIFRNFFQRSGVRVLMFCWLLAPFLQHFLGPATGGGAHYRHRIMACMFVRWPWRPSHLRRPSQTVPKAWDDRTARSRPHDVAGAIPAIQWLAGAPVLFALLR
jgi:hypothetical protein